MKRKERKNNSIPYKKYKQKNYKKILYIKNRAHTLFKHLNDDIRIYDSHAIQKKENQFLYFNVKCRNVSLFVQFLTISISINFIYDFQSMHNFCPKIKHPLTNTQKNTQNTPMIRFK